MDRPFPSDDRLQLMQRGVQQLSTWLSDLLRVGLLEYDFSPDSLQELAGRMVDAKLAGIARRIRLLSELNKSDKHWKRDLLQALTKLHLFTVNFQKLDSQSAIFQQTLLSVAGFIIKKEQLPQEEAIVDHWVPWGISHSQEENLRVRRCWVAGMNSKRVAMLLDFAWGRTDYTQEYHYNKTYTGALVYYPSTFPMRAQLFNPQVEKKSAGRLPSFQSFETFLLQYAKAIARNPWIGSFPAAFSGMQVIRNEGAFYLLDKNGGLLPIDGSNDLCWALMGAGAGHHDDLQLFGEWSGFELAIISFSATDKVHDAAWLNDFA
ncbi:MAG: hypothetical protein HKN87_12890 [Saprospiraceae bacterium]|nr:hypothetical protein [Saprospiraceae bacterium]